MSSSHEIRTETTTVAEHPVKQERLVTFDMLKSVRIEIGEEIENTFGD